MQRIFTWLMIFGVLAGINMHVLAADGGCVVCFDQSEDCCAIGSNASESAVQESRTPEKSKCPGDHLHHPGCCSHVMGLAIVPNPECRFGISYHNLLEFRHEGEAVPDGPYLRLEKPPLI